MSVEQNIAKIIGEQAVQICLLTEQLQQANDKVKELENKDKKTDA